MGSLQFCSWPLHHATMKTLQKNSAGCPIYFYLQWIEHMTFAFQRMPVLWCAASYYHTSRRWLLMWYLTGYGYVLEEVTRCLMIRAVFSQRGREKGQELIHTIIFNFQPLNEISSLTELMAHLNLFSRNTFLSFFFYTQDEKWNMS